MFRNLNAEQKRFNMNNQQLAEFLGFKDRKSVEVKKATGAFTLPECKKLARHFGVTLDYLFETAEDRAMKEAK